MIIANKKFLVTGGNSGIGFATAKKLIDSGAFVTILGKREEALKAAADNIDSNKISYIVCDLSNLENIQRVSNQIISSDFDGIVNAAGIIEYGKLEEHSITRISDVINVNLTGLISMTNIVLPSLKRKNDGVIVNISSTSGIYRRANESVYVASKWGVQGFTESMQVELENTKIKVIGIYPGGVDTPLFEKSDSQKKPEGNIFMSPEEIAEIILFSIKQPDSVKLDKLVINRAKQ